MSASTVDRRPGKPFLMGRGLVKTYGADRALAGVDLNIRTGEVLAIVGPSGSGKTTLLHVLAGILRPDEGEVTLDGHRIDQLGEAKRSALRRHEFGFIFQQGLLVGELTAAENTALPLLLAGADRTQALAGAREWLGRLGLGGLENRLPGQLSGGQAQRVAIARALAHRPKVIFADEPTGSLDTRTAAETTQALFAAAADTEAAVVIVTHDRELAAKAARIVEIRDGMIVGGVMIG
ncbi:ABC transporter ATP-binding protein [Saccharopolyspora phatthalungensis]|uniref:Putative ABC transport system ATP-binding protein n=1 Tax=Saccharopolyspora phatthalungensis TaxID=664693 RepID=A0A840Q1L7_9PSEU|nr:ABC transporter ATP-binding protein [Saccharopolyspora phatthalungensis]MBB5154406.1 putative ABC transport system ATP-binding protein [Saccharopolyspora phatthalungensis]